MPRYSSSRGSHPSAGAVGGSANEAGSAFRKRVAAWVLCHALTGRDLPGLDLSLPPGEAAPSALDLETDFAVDDLHVELSGSAHVYVQAKRKLQLSQTGPFASAVSQLCRFVTSRTMDHETTRLVLACADASQPILALQRALRRGRASRPGSNSTSESEALDVFDGLIASLPAEQQTLLRACTVILRLDVEQDGLGAAEEAESMLAGSVVPREQARLAWGLLQGAAAELARTRQGLAAEDVLGVLRNAGLTLIADRQGVLAARLEAARIAIDGYREDLGQPVLSLVRIGAIPPIPLPEVDAKTKVKAPADRDTASGDFAQKVRRRGRVLLTGLPGSGKSTVLKLGAAHWAGIADWPCPILVDLKDLNQRRREDTAGSPLDSVLSLATADYAPEDRGLLTEELQRRAGTGDLCLLLDSLDETRSDRGRMVEYLQRLVGQVHPDVEIVLATRDVGYADAHTLGFKDLKLLPPENMMPTVTRILEEAASFNNLAGSEATHWVRERKRRIAEILARDRHLKETPLIPVLLAVLAATGTDPLSGNRAAILIGVIEMAARRWEIGVRENDVDIGGGLNSGEAAAALLEAYEALSRLVLSTPTVTSEAASTIVQQLLERRYAAAAGRAPAMASSIIHFWDEAGTFVLTADGLLMPRLNLLAEIGAARWLAGLDVPEQAAEVSALAESGGQGEVLLLASQLSQPVLDQLIENGVSKHVLPLLLLAARAVTEGGNPSAPMQQALISGLIDRLRQGQGPWDATKALIDLPVPATRQSEVADAFAESLPPDFAPIGLALLMKRWGVLIAGGEEILLGILTGESPPFDTCQHVIPKWRSKYRVEMNTAGSVPSEDYAEAYAHAASVLLPSHAECAETVAEVAVKLAGGRADLVDVLRANARPDLADRVQEAWLGPLAHWGGPGPRPTWDAFFYSVGKLGRQVPLSPGQVRRMDELADLVATLRMGEWPADALLDLPRDEWLAHYQTVVEAIGYLGGFDNDILASEGRIASAGYQSDMFATTGFLYDGGESKDLAHWRTVPDVSSLQQRLVQALAAPSPLCIYAAICLWEAPNGREVARLIENGPDLGALAHPNRSIAARLLLHLDDVGLERTKTWMQATDPVLRAEAAHQLADLVSEIGDEQAERLILASLTDSDAGVQEAALENLKVVPPSLVAEVSRIAGERPVNFVCRHCGYSNDPYSESCGTCEAHAPDPRSAAEKLLNQACPTV